MKKIILVISAMLATGTVTAQSLDCELLKDEILRQHRLMTVNQCEFDYQQCLNRARNQFDQANCGIANGSCGIAQAIGRNNMQTNYEENLATYKRQCE